MVRGSVSSKYHYFVFSWLHSELATAHQSNPTAARKGMIQMEGFLDTLNSFKLHSYTPRPTLESLLEENILEVLRGDDLG